MKRHPERAAVPYVSILGAAALFFAAGAAAAQDADIPKAFEFLSDVMRMSDDPPPENRLSTLCQVQVVPDDGRTLGYYSLLSVDARRVFIIAYSSHELERPWETMAFKSVFVPAGATSRIDAGTADWAYVFDRNGDGRIDFLAYRVGPLWLLPEGKRIRDYPKVKSGVKEDFLEANRDKLGEGFWFLADENFDGTQDVLIARVIDKSSGWTDGWVVAEDKDFDRAYDVCYSTRGSLEGKSTTCRPGDPAPTVRDHTIAGLNVMLLPSDGVPLAAFNQALEACGSTAGQLYRHPYPPWSDYTPEPPDFTAQSIDETRVACYERHHNDSCLYLAETDDAKALVTLGGMYADGRGIEKDETAAVSWYQRAADLGDPEGQSKLGAAYAAGLGVGQDSARAAEWYRRAADQDYAAAQYLLGDAYLNGYGVEKNETLAAELMLQSATQGYAKAQLMLGWMTADGIGVPQDEVAAAEWYRKAADQGLAGALYSLGTCYAQGKGIPQDATEALSCYRRSAEMGYGPAEFQMAIQYFRGIDGEPDFVEGNRWLERAARHGLPDAQFILAGHYLMGRGVPENIVYSYAWLIVAAENGHSKAIEMRDGIRPLLSKVQRAEGERIARNMLGQ